MRTTLIISLIILSCFKVYCQDSASVRKDTTTFLDRLFIGVGISPNLSYRSLTSPDSVIFIKNYRDTSESIRNSYAARINASYLLTRNLMLNSGLVFSDRGYRINNFNSTNSRYDLHYYYVSIPLIAQYTYTKDKFNFFIKGGFDFGLLMGQRSSLFIKSSENNIKKYDLQEQNAYNKFNVSLNLGLGLAFNLNSTTGVYLSPEYMRSFNNLSNTPVKLYWNSFAASFGIIKKIKP